MPYYGGIANCGDIDNNNNDNDDNNDDNDNNNDNNNNDDKYLCPSCGTIGMDECQRHGSKYILYKCCCCCKPAVFFCFGTTHFCHDCHLRPRHFIKNPHPCPGIDKCAIKIKHPPNDGTTRFSIGCGLCLPKYLTNKYQIKYANGRISQ